MEIKKIQDGSKMILMPEGRLDTETAPLLEEEVNALEGITELVFDFKKLGYISSAGLRVLLAAQKNMGGKGSMKIINVNELIMEVFEVTGFQDILTIE